MMKTVLITGANRGIGLGLVKHYLDLGWRVYAACRQPDEAIQLHDIASTALNILQLDTSNELSISALQPQLHDIKLNLVFNNAGISIEEDIDDWSYQGFITSFATNTIGPALIAQSLLPNLSNDSKVIQLSSGRASLSWNQSPLDGLDGYGASKAALNMLTRRLAAKLKPKNIIVTSVSPGWVKTDTGTDAAPTEVSDAANMLAAVAEKLTLNDSGKFLDELGNEIPY